MKKILTILSILSYLLIFSQVKENLVIPKQPKIGLSLAGGGAKGFAHVGVLKVLDSLGIKIDYISGTSMGAIVGGLYASGYTGKDIEKIVMETDFYNLLSNTNNRAEASFFDKSVDKYILKVPIKNGKVTLPASISSGQKNIYLLKELFKNVSNIQDFSKLPIPFMCVATNLETGKLKIFDKGDISESILASSAFPSLMDPVKVGDSIYVDGAMTVNYPSEFLKKKGIDIVIGVDLNQGLNKREKINSIVDILNQVIDFGIVKETKNQLKYTDINIKPNLKGLGVTSFDEKGKILKSGYTEALKYAEILNKLPKKNYDYLRIPVNPIYSNIYKIDDIEIENNKIYNRDYILGKMNLKLPSSQTYGSINKMLDKLYATNNFKIINYDIVQKDNKNLLKLIVTEDNNRFFMKFGLHYDEVFKSGLLANVTIKRFLFNNSSISIDGVFGDKPRYYINYFVDNGYIPGFGIYSSGMSFDLKDKSGINYENWKWYRNDIFIQSIWKDKFALGFGLSHDIFTIRNTNSTEKKGFSYTNPYLFIKSDTQNNTSFPTEGIYINITGKLFGFFFDSNIENFLQLSGKFKFNIPINKNFTYRLSTFGGISLGQPINVYNFYIGEIFEQNLGNFVPFSGYYFGQEKSQNIISVTNTIQYNFFKNYFLLGSFNSANLFNDINNIGKDIVKFNHTSFGITAGYSSPFGQIKLNISKAIDSNNQVITSVILGHWF